LYPAFCSPRPDRRRDTSEIGQSTDTMRMPPLKGNAILISSVLFYWKNWISVKVLAEYSFLVHFSFKPQTSVFKFFFAVYNRSVHRALFFKKKLKKESYEKASPRSWRPRVAGCQKKTKNSAESRRKGREEEPKGGGPTLKAATKTTLRRDGGENLPS
jgi:hypothetical protein